MFDSVANFLHSVAFGILSMVIVGSSWCLVGLTMGAAPKHDIHPTALEICEGGICVCAGFLIACVTSTWSTASPKVTLLCVLGFFVTGFLVFFNLQVMSMAMQRGPNGIIWAILQSAMVCPFLLGVFCFGEEATWIRWMGLALMLLALVCFACAKDTQKGAGHLWKLLAFLCFTICSIQQCITMLPSYYEEAKGFPIVLRMACTAAGRGTAPLVFLLCQHRQGKWAAFCQETRRPVFWKFIGALLFVELFLSFLLFYPGLNIMAAAGLGNACYPILIGSCIISFTLASVFLLKERLRPLPLAALLCCLFGIFFICKK